ncbi:MAG: hypothetical protein LQ352_003264 [Teloschistes flavicans]|nr:MAG: hypothetical protein LQ352_003264 [Teloschistes flavicans]
MSLEPYQSQYYRAITPPYSGVPYARNDGRHSRHTSISTVCSQNSSPESVATHATTPSRSPIRQHGPTLLPKLRTQDATLQPSLPRPGAHRRASSQALPQTRTTQLSRPGMQRSTTSPPECVNLVSPASATSAASTWAATSAISSPVTVSSSYSRKLGGHARTSSTPWNVSTSRPLNSAPYRSGTPTYKARPAYYTTSVNPGASTFVPPPIHTYQPTYASGSYDASIASDFVYVSEDEPRTSLQKYLSAPNPAVNLVERVNIMNGYGQHSHFWWDIRNLTTWDDFNLETMMAVPGFNDLLNVEIKAAALSNPTIPHSRLHPASESALQDIYSSFYCPKVSSALRSSIYGQNYLSMRADKTRDGPHFIANYQNDFEKTLAGNGRGRVVGIVKTFDRWNTSMRHEMGQRRVEYLAGLSHIHRYMREHSCRYGFIITEIELVCVRLGTSEIPHFGALELASTIELKQQKEGLTACLALWYLHMLAKDEPLPGQLGWRVEIGPPGDVTRSKVMEKKDVWIPEPGMAEKRCAKTIRGWVMPSDPWNRKKEGGKTTRALREVKGN